MESTPNPLEVSSAVPAAQSCVLVLNAGSSSVKFALFSANQIPTRHLTGAIEGIGRDHGRFHAIDETGRIWADEVRHSSNQEDAIELIQSGIERHGAARTIVAVGHRIVHGGPGCDCPETVPPQLEERLKGLIPLAPLHLPHNLAGLAAVRARRPNLPQVACFDTAFHETLPKLARMTGLPRDIAGQDIRRYGFHGLSYEFVVDEILRTHGTLAADERMIVAHLGNGASMAAIKGGRSVETTMGFSTLACGASDPHVARRSSGRPGRLDRIGGIAPQDRRAEIPRAPC